MLERFVSDVVVQVFAVNLLLWSSGLNPYNVYGHCDGGVPNEQGYLSGFDVPTLSFPDVFPWPKEKRRQYEEV